MNYYLDAIKNKYAIFSGRARRKEYWMFFLFNFIIGIVVGIALGLLGEILNQDLTWLWYLYGLALLLPSIAVLVRRLHDTGRSAWWLFIFLIPFVGVIVILVFLVQDGVRGDNKYGPDPKGVAAVQ